MKVLIQVILTIAALLMGYLGFLGFRTDPDFALLAIAISGICAGGAYRLR